MAEETTNNQEPTEAENQDESTETLNQDESTETENQGSDEFEDSEDVDESDESDESEDEEKPIETKTQEQINQEAVNKRINKLTFEKHEERRKREEIEAKYQKALEKQKELEGKSNKVEIPSMPDPYDPEYTVKLQERDKAIQEKARLDAAAEAAQKLSQERAEQKRLEQEKIFRSQTEAMYSTAEKAGITKEEIQKAEQTVSLFIVDPALAQYVLAHKDSAFIVNHLANDVQELEKIGRMTPINASAYIATTVVPKAKKFKPGIPTAPDPLSIPSGGPGGPEDPYLKGVTFS